jgi:hypothetical protein
MAENGYQLGMVETKIQSDALLLTGVRKKLQNNGKFAVQRAAKSQLNLDQFSTNQQPANSRAPASIRQILST